MQRYLLTTLALLAAFMVSCSWPEEPAQVADQVLRSGRSYTVDAQNPLAVLMEGELIRGELPDE